MLPQPRRRWAFFPRSVVSDHDNPAAHLYRAMASQIAALDDEARFYEQRVNPWLRNMLQHEGARSLLTFRDRHPDVQYVTYDRKWGQELADWLNLVLATADIAVVDPAAPDEIVRWVGELTRPHLQTFLLDPYGELQDKASQLEQLTLYRGVCVATRGEPGIDVSDEQYLIPFGPAVPEPGSNGNAARHIEQTAAHIVQQMVEAVDETLARQEDHSPDAM